MLISRLVKDLEKIKDEHGDIDVIAYDERSDDYEVTDTEYNADVPHRPVAILSIEKPYQND